MGLWSDGVTSAVNFLADKFAIVEAGTGKTPVVPFLVQDGVVYINSALIGSLDAGVITSGTLTGRTIQTKADPGTGDRSRMVLDAASNTLILYGADGTPTVVIEGGENAVIDVNTDGLYGLEVSCVDPAVGSNVTLYAIGGGMHGAVLPKYGLAGRGSAGGILISPAASSSSPNGVVSGDIGAVYVTSGGDFYGCKGGSTWVKFG